MKHVATARLVLAAAFALFAISGALAQVPRGHAHNDYEHARPLADALAHGFTSIEADIWMRDGELLIGHDEADLDPSRTLRSLYLDPLRAAVAGRDASDPLLLLIDIKTDGPATYAALDEVLSDYADVLTRVEDGQVIPGPVMAVVSGNRPGDEMLADPSRYAFYDGRLSDLENGPEPAFMPLVSDNWTRHFSWKGSGEMPGNEREKLAGLVERARAAGYHLRFWATPDVPGPARDALWHALAEAGVDFINTDDLVGFAEFSAGLTKQ